MSNFRAIAECLQVCAGMLLDENYYVEHRGGQSCAYYHSHSTAQFPHHTGALPNVLRLCDVLRSFLLFIFNSLLLLRRWRTPSAVFVHALTRALGEAYFGERQSQTFDPRGDRVHRGKVSRKTTWVLSSSSRSLLLSPQVGSPATGEEVDKSVASCWEERIKVDLY